MGVCMFVPAMIKGILMRIVLNMEGKGKRCIEALSVPGRMSCDISGLSTGRSHLCIVLVRNYGTG